MEINKFNGTNNDWLRNLKIILDFENQGYVLDKPLPTALPEGSSPIILASMTNEIQKQYDRLEDVPSIMLHMKYVYTVPDRHIRYATTKAFFGTKMTEGSSVHSHGVKMLSLVEKLEDLKSWEKLQLQSERQGCQTLEEEEGQRRSNQSLEYCVLSGRRQMMCARIAKERGIGKGSVHNSSSTQVRERSRRLSKDEMILRLSDGKIVAAEAVGSLRLVVSNHIRIDLKDYYFVPNVCAPLSIPARGEFSYFITFTDDHSRLEVENQTNRKIKALRSDRGGEYLSGEFIDYLKENEILSQWTPPGTPQLNGVAERKNGTLLDMVRSMMSFTEFPTSFWGYTLETAAKLLNIAPSKSVPLTPYEIWHGKPASYKYLRVWGSPAYVKRLVGDKLDSGSSLCRFIGYPKETVGYYFYDPTEQKNFISRNAVFLEKGFPSDSRRDEVLIKESNKEPHHDSTTSFEPTVHTDGVPVLRRSLENLEYPRGRFVGLTSQLDNDPKTYGEAMSDIDSDKWLEAMKSKMDSMGSNQVWTS
ncbi:UNVERIFIED_CONTAM: hypothetical protein Slati_2513600 [Sesamum latifolium]|uniref:Integrase catalytic domain-containing protein n=1 Tax=Sesamum latifolium TaxID=2727402 RepID=A0AAW2WKH7_9LAMI